MPGFDRIEIRSALKCQGGTMLGVLYAEDLTDATDVLAVEDQESLTFSFPRVDKLGNTRALVTSLVPRAIATIMWDDGSFDEWRVSLIESSRGESSPIRVSANPLSTDLAEGADSSTGKGIVSSVSGCLRVFDFATGALTATQVWDTYIIPNCPSWVTRGTIDPSVLIPSMGWSRLTPWALALQVRDALRKMNVTCELQLRRNGTTDYKLDLVTQIGATATVPIFHPRTSLQSLRRRFDTTQQATRLFVTGETDPSGLPGIPGRARWLVTNVDGGTKKLTLADPNGGSGPIGFTNQWFNTYVLRTLTGRTFQIQASDAGAQTVTLLDVSTFATGETIEFRLTEPGTNTRVRANPNTRFAISAVGGGTLTLSGDPITVNNQHVDWYAKVWTTSTPGTGSVVGTPQRISATVASTDVITPASTSGFTTSHFVEFVQLDGAGEIPSYLDHPTFVQAAPTGYGLKAGDLAVSSVVGTAQIQPNAWMRTWTNSSNPPDGYSAGVISGALTATTRNTNTAFIRYGPFSLKVDFLARVFARAQACPIAWATGNTRVSVRCNLIVTAGNGATGMDLKLYAAGPDGLATGTALATVSIAPPAFTSIGPATNFNVWTTMEILGVDLAPEQCPYGVVASLETTDNGGGSSGTVYVDTIEVFPFVDNPDAVFEFGDATVLHQAGNRRLASNGTPPVTYELTVHDLERSDPATWNRNKLTKGGNVRALDPDSGVDTTVRLMRWQRDLLRPQRSQVTLAMTPVLLTQVALTQ